MTLKNLVAILLLAPLFAGAQTKSFHIEGHIPTKMSGQKIYFDYTDNAGKGKEDSCTIINDRFHFTGQVSGMASCRMSMDHEKKGKPFSIYSPGADAVYFYFGAENIRIESKDSLANAMVSGSKIYAEHQEYLRLTGGSIMALNKKFNTIVTAAGPAKQQDSVFMNNLNKRYRAILQERTDKQFAFAKTHPNSAFALVALSESAGSKVDVAKIKPVYDALSPALRNTDVGKELGQRINAVNSTEIGRPAPQFSQQDTAGKTISLKDYRGKYVLVEFWASWCVPCRAGNPNLITQYNLYKDKGFDIISVSLDHIKKNWIEAIKKDGLQWKQVSDLKGWNNEVARQYGIRQVPSSFLLDPQGIIIGNTLRDESLNEKLREIFTDK